MKKRLYEWWKNHRRIGSFTGFLILIGLYLLPVIKEATYKNTCIKFSTKGALTKFNEDNIKEKLLEETGLTIKELARIEGYKNCIK